MTRSYNRDLRVTVFLFFAIKEKYCYLTLFSCFYARKNKRISGFNAKYLQSRYLIQLEFQIVNFFKI